MASLATASIALSFALLAGAAPAFAIASKNPKAHAPLPIRVDERQARDIAWQYGVLHIEEIALSGTRWEIAGRDGLDGIVLIEVDAHSGSVQR